MSAQESPRRTMFMYVARLLLTEVLHQLTLTPPFHLQTVHGANSTFRSSLSSRLLTQVSRIEFALNSTFDTLRTSTCTSCLVAQDLSNYCACPNLGDDNSQQNPPIIFSIEFLFIHISTGFPKLYFRDPQTGKFEEVPNGGTIMMIIFKYM